MSGNPAAPRHEVPEFRLIGGEPSLDFANTAEWSTEDSLLVERIPDYESLVRWAGSANVVAAHTARKLLSQARRNREAAARALMSAHAVRRVIHSAFGAVARSSMLAEDGNALDTAVAALDELLHEALKRRRIVTERGRVRFHWDGMGDRLNCIEWPIVWNAAELLASDAVQSVRLCAGKDCGWLYVDRSRNRLRRWCSMETCGSREKAHRHYARVKQRERDLTDLS